MEKFKPKDEYTCRKCGRKVPRQSVVWVGNGVALCETCSKTYEKPKKEKP